LEAAAPYRSWLDALLPYKLLVVAELFRRRKVGGFEIMLDHATQTGWKLLDLFEQYRDQLLRGRDPLGGRARVRRLHDLRGELTQRFVIPRSLAMFEQPLVAGNPEDPVLERLFSKDDDGQLLGEDVHGAICQLDRARLVELPEEVPTEFATQRRLQRFPGSRFALANSTKQRFQVHRRTTYINPRVSNPVRKTTHRQHPRCWRHVRRETRVRFTCPEVEVSSGSDDEIPKVWSDLMWAIADRERLRRTLPIVEPSAPPEPPYNFHGYEVTAYVLGGMGMVLLGRDPKLERKVALKLLQSSGPEADAKLMAEAKTLARLSHPNVVTLYGVDEWEGGVFFTMEFVDGVNGQEWLKRRPTRREVLDVFIDAGQGLAAAHDKEIQHGDFKPANMLIGSDGRTRVADFGIADYLRVDDSGEQATGRRAGTPEYMAPERLQGHRGDARSDQYSFCAALWSGLHGERPFRGKTAFELLDAIESGVIHPRVPDARVPRWLTEVVRKGLAEDPDQRYRDMAELLRALKDEPPDDATATDDSDDDDSPLEHEGRVLHAPATPAGAAPQRARWPIGVIGLLSASVLVLGVIMLTQSPAPEPTAGVIQPEAYPMILGLIAADRFTEAQQMWSDHAPDLTDEQSLKIGRDWLARAREVAPDDRAKAKEAAAAAVEAASRVQQDGDTEAAKTVGGQLATEAKIYELITRDEFAEAEQYWLDNKAQLTDDQALQLADDCLALAPLDRTKAQPAVMAAYKMANRVQQFGSTEVARTRGGQLATAAKALHDSRPPER
jgi:serine/threonine protein kinase